MNKIICKNLQNIDRNKSVQYGECSKAAQVDILGCRRKKHYIHAIYVL